MHIELKWILLLSQVVEDFFKQLTVSEIWGHEYLGVHLPQLEVTETKLCPRFLMLQPQENFDCTTRIKLY